MLVHAKEAITHRQVCVVTHIFPRVHKCCGEHKVSKEVNFFDGTKFLRVVRKIMKNYSETWLS